MRNRYGGHGRGAGRGGGRPGGGFGAGSRFATARSERMLDRAELQVLLLSLLNDSPRHGYELIRAIKSLTEGCYAPSPGMVYPVLNAMAEAGLAAPTEEDSGRKSFAITAAGSEQLSQEAQALAAVVERLKALPGSQAQTRAPIARALANLDLVLANVSPEVSAEQVDQIVTLIDGVARQIERIG